MNSTDLTILITALCGLARGGQVFSMTLSQEAWDSLAKLSNAGFVRQSRDRGDVLMFEGIELRRTVS